jgi:hypothetical protein
MNVDFGTEDPAFEALDRRIASLAEAIRPAEVFRRLLEGSRQFAPRSTLFLLRERSWTGWGTSGYDRSVSERFRQVRVPAGSGTTNPSFAAGIGNQRYATLPEDALPDFGQPPASATLAVPLRAGARTIGFLVVQRGPGENPWLPSALGILVTAARLRLELDLTLRKLNAAAAMAAPERPIAVAAPESAPAPSPPAASSAPAESSVAPWVEKRESAGDSQRREEARRFARLVATDIRLYNEEAVVLGRRNRDLFRRLEEQIERGREAFDRRFPDLGAPGRTVLHEAYVEILAGGDSDLLPVPTTDEGPQGTTRST